MQKYTILAQVQKDQKMEQEFQELRRQQDIDLRELAKARQDMETEIEKELSAKLRTKWNDRAHICPHGQSQGQ